MRKLVFATIFLLLFSMPAFAQTYAIQDRSIVTQRTFGADATNFAGTGLSGATHCNTYHAKANTTELSVDAVTVSGYGAPATNCSIHQSSVLLSSADTNLTDRTCAVSATLDASLDYQLCFYYTAGNDVPRHLTGAIQTSHWTELSSDVGNGQVLDVGSVTTTARQNVAPPAEAPAPDHTYEGIIAYLASTYSNWNDRTTYGNDFTASGTPTSNLGFLGNGVTSTQATRAVTSLATGNGNYFTFCTWTYPNASQTRTLWQEGDATTEGHEYRLYQDGTDLVFDVKKNATRFLCNAELSTPLTLNTWQHVCLVHNGLTSTFYTDGVAGNSETCDYDPPAGGSAVTLGNLGRGDEYMMANRTMSPTEIQDMYDSTVAGVTYPFVNCKVNYNTFIASTGWTLTREEFRAFRTNCMNAGRREKS